MKKKARGRPCSPGVQKRESRENCVARGGCRRQPPHPDTHWVSPEAAVTLLHGPSATIAPEETSIRNSLFLPFLRTCLFYARILVSLVRVSMSGGD